MTEGFCFLVTTPSRMGTIDMQLNKIDLSAHGFFLQIFEELKT